MTELTARAEVPTTTPERYAKQLLAHLGRRVEWSTDGDTATASIAGGTGSVVVGDGLLILLAKASDTETLHTVQHVLGSHLERFGQRNELVVQWASSVSQASGPTPPAPQEHRRPTASDGH